MHHLGRRELVHPPHQHPEPLIGRHHPSHPHQPQHAQHLERRRQRQHGRVGRHHRAQVIGAGGTNPVTVQLHGSDTVLSLPLAQHVTTAMVGSGVTVAVMLFDELDPSDGVIVAAY